MSEPALFTDAEPAGGVSVVFADAQVRYTGATRHQFVRTVLRVTSEMGAREVGQQKFSFVPPHQRLILHRLEVRRGENLHSHLAKEAVTVLQREPGLESQVYDGARTAVVVLPDVRVGDLVAVEYSVLGQNPVLGGHVGEQWILGGPIGIGRFRFRAVADRPLGVRRFAGAPELERRTARGAFEYIVEGDQPTPPRFEEGVPAEDDVYPMIQVSDFGSWEEVAKFGAELFRKPPRRSQQVAQAAKEVRWRAGMSRGDSLVALRFVQEEIRYLSLAFGESTHRPADPDLVLQRRFGDCKDKALLLVTLLEELGVKAYPALVSTKRGLHLFADLPSLSAFDHVIVNVPTKKGTFWLDPSRLYQRGPIEAVSVRGYGAALVLSPAETDLTPMVDRPPKQPDIHTQLDVDVKVLGGATRLATRTTYSGFMADAVRALHVSSSEEVFANAVGGQVKKTYPNAQRAGKAEFKDDERGNLVTVSLEFTLNDDWLKDDRGRPTLSLFPPWMSERLPPVVTGRARPLVLGGPVWIVQDTHVHFAGFEVAPIAENVSHSAFAFEVTRKNAKDGFKLHSSLQLKAARLEPVDFDSYREGHARAGAALAFGIMKLAEPRDLGKWPPGWLSLLMVSWVAAIVAGLVRVHRRQPYLKRPRVEWVPSAAGFRGWLIPIGIGVCLAPMRIGFGMVAGSDAYSATNLAWVMDHENPSFDPLLAPLLLVELLLNVVLLVGSVYVGYLFWARRRTFPLAFVSLLGLSVVTIVGDAIAAAFLSTPPAASVRDVRIWFSIPITLLWIGYTLHSERVKATFLPPPEEAL